ncbi:MULTISPECIES: hypothetical protein [unclassified Rhizobium]|uniref:hypothetical protein n=1 Tax=unclassified Rhizobium TaxID=2613769 RepID=UPI00160F6149|nr:MULTISPECIES: hypothetical protein [unclassified Rhizobium]MBB3545209.1 hypothetical protein [Rhizobium sp. BK399]MCS4096169.1 hypothetical protein [Rhizobium sp. BK176]
MSKSFDEMTVIERQEAFGRLICLLHRMRQDAADQGSEHLVRALDEMLHAVRGALPLLLEGDGNLAADVMKQAIKLIFANAKVDSSATNSTLH